MILTHPSYDNIEFAVKHIIDQLDALNFQPELLVGLARGGLVPTLLLSETLNVPLRVVHYSSKVGKGNNKNHSNVLPEFNEQRILFVDDITDGGHTMQEVYNHYATRHDVKTAVIYYKESSVYQPDIFWWKLPANAPFINFPWEKNLRYKAY